MSITKNKKMLIKGAGKFTAKIPGCDELLTLGTMNNMKLDIQLDMQDIEGGDSSVPLDTLLKKKVIDITAEDAKFDLNMVRLVTGSKLKEGISGDVYKMISETLTLADGGAGDITATITEDPATGSVPAISVHTSTGVLGTSDFSVAGKVITVTGGAASGDTITVYYPVATEADPDGYVWVLEEKHQITEEAGGNCQITLSFGPELFNERGSQTKHISIRGIKSNKLMKQKDSGVPTENEYVVDPTTGTITFNSAMKDIEVYVNYKRNEVVDVIAITSKDMPLTVSVVHDGLSEQKDGSIQGFQTELFACRVKSNFSIDATRQQASTHSIVLTVIDPERVDNKLGTIKRYEIANDSIKDLC